MPVYGLVVAYPTSTLVSLFKMGMMIPTFEIIVRIKLDKVDKTLSTIEMLNKCSASHPGKSFGYFKQDGIFTTCSKYRKINP